ncbi:unnamed protein product [Cuscuta europaea]|uniref:Uncharacterized protein n=1 Tax=Cuscuta europaea TaxID=41803 RepID=A0A9P0YXG0_CUSEU|nr:unnamed protein product [Cuscuta europaea]
MSRHEIITLRIMAGLRFFCDHFICWINFLGSMLLYYNINLPAQTWSRISSGSINSSSDSEPVRSTGRRIECQMERLPGVPAFKTSTNGFVFPKKINKMACL